MKKPRPISRPISRLWGLVGIGLLLMVWDWGHRVYGALVLPRLDDTLHALFAMIRDGRAAPALAKTAGHALTGWLGGAGAGVIVGTLAGLSNRARAALQPVAIIFLGIPAIAWVVMALLWFGGGWAVVFTIAVTTGPLVFAAAVEGVRALDGGLSRMAEVYRVPFGAARAGARIPGGRRPAARGCGQISAPAFGR